MGPFDAPEMYPGLVPKVSVSKPELEMDAAWTDEPQAMAAMAMDLVTFI
jgi:hypothetical protein